MSIRAGSLGSGMSSKPIMDLTFTVQIYRESGAYTKTGSLVLGNVPVGGLVQCDIAPITDMVDMQQSSENEVATHVLHFPLGTNLLARDAIRVITSQDALQHFDGYYITQVLRPTESISYIRALGVYGKKDVIFQGL